MRDSKLNPTQSKMISKKYFVGDKMNGDWAAKEIFEGRLKGYRLSREVICMLLKIENLTWTSPAAALRNLNRKMFCYKKFATDGKAQLLVSCILSGREAGSKWDEKRTAGRKHPEINYLRQKAKEEIKRKLRGNV